MRKGWFLFDTKLFEVLADLSIILTQTCMWEANMVDLCGGSIYIYT